MSYIDKRGLLVKLTRECHIQHVLNGGSNQVAPTTGQSSTLENVDDIVPGKFQASEALQKPLTPNIGTHIMIFIPES